MHMYVLALFFCCDEVVVSCLGMHVCSKFGFCYDEVVCVVFVMKLCFVSVMKLCVVFAVMKLPTAQTHTVYELLTVSKG